jgi:peroxiredoxin
MAKRRLAKPPSAKEKRQAKSRWTAWALIGGTVVVVGVMIGLVVMQSGSKSTRGKAHVGSPAPDFTLRLLNGQSVTLSSLKGKPVVLSFWASDCPHCQREAPVVAKMYANYRDKGLALLSISVFWDTDSGAKKFVEEYRLPFPVGRDSDAVIGSLYGVDSTPNTFFIAKDGKVVGRVDGEMEEAAFEQRINSLLAS